VSGAAIVAGFVAAVVVGLGLGCSGWHRWVGVLVGPVTGIAIIAVSRHVLSNAPLNDEGGDMSAQILGQAIGYAVIVLYVVGYAAGVGARAARARWH
jgi:hypothetical protein